MVANFSGFERFICCDEYLRRTQAAVVALPRARYPLCISKESAANAAFLMTARSSSDRISSLDFLLSSVKIGLDGSLRITVVRWRAINRFRNQSRPPMR